MDDAFLMGMLNRVAALDEEPEGVLGGKLGFVAVVGDADALDQLHNEERPAGGGGTGVEDLGDIRVVHEGERLALLLEACDDVAGVHADLNYLERDTAADGALLFGDPDAAEAALADLL